MVRRLRGEVSLHWQDKKYRVWVFEELGVWIPDCLEKLSSISGSGDLDVKGRELPENGRVPARDVNGRETGGGLSSMHGNSKKVPEETVKFPMQEELKDHGNNLYSFASPQKEAVTDNVTPQSMAETSRHGTERTTFVQKFPQQLFIIFSYRYVPYRIPNIQINYYRKQLNK
ncbi:hypothetical protein Hanom_Chr00s009257g01742581 [Helianthus anomalus]